ncbi:AMP-binding protein [Hyphomicrobium sp.]|uniref:class I adenylate-forming enzyme family protein n=1 Tax=Hyphomicrobium sp. TaxID=82 RepID=UPI0025BB80BB|nr:AMP-binding protein [Hyphomicrobium sp.]
MIKTHARLRPHKIGVRDSKRSFTFARWDERCSRLANAMLALGLRKGDRVALYAYNTVEWMELYVGLSRAGLIAVPINFRLVGREISYILTHCNARAVVAQNDLRENMDAIRSSPDLKDLSYILLGGEKAPEWLNYEALLEGASSEAPAVEVGPEDVFAVMYTSGTTGNPKGAIRRHGANSLIAILTAYDLGFSENDVGLFVMPMCHANSLYFSLTFSYLGATCVIDDRKSFDPEAVLRDMARQKVTFTSLVPTHFTMMLGLPEEIKARHDVSAIEKLMISSAPAREDTKLAIIKHFQNSRLFELYGSTEAGWVTLLRPDDQIHKLGSVGREWSGTGAIKFLDANGDEVPDGEVGELFSRTPFVFDGYWNDPQKTADAFRGAWCSVGDMGRRDQDGFIHLVDRKSNLIISGGENIYPSEVEGVIGAHPAVKDVAVIGVPDEKWGESVRSIIVAHAGQTVTETEILDWCKARMAGYKRPRSIIFVSDADMPRTPTGKILHRILRQRFGDAAPASTSTTE